MIALLLDMLFGLAGIVALAAMWSTVARYGPSVLDLRREVEAFDPVRFVDSTVTEYRPVAAGTVLRPDFTAPRRAIPAQSARLRAAA